MAKTVLCRGCDHRKPQEGAKFLCERRVPLCPHCFGGFWPYIRRIVPNVTSRFAEHATLLVILAVRLSCASGKPASVDKVDGVLGQLLAPADPFQQV